MVVGSNDAIQFVSCLICCDTVSIEASIKCATGKHDHCAEFIDHCMKARLAEKNRGNIQLPECCQKPLHPSGCAKLLQPATLSALVYQMQHELKDPKTVYMKPVEEEIEYVRKSLNGNM